MARVVFSAIDGAHGAELWISDGTAAGTQLVRDLNPGAAGSGPGGFTAAGPLIYFVASDGTARELWRTDGTAAGTYALSTPVDGAAPQTITPVGSSVFWFGTDTTHGAGLFTANGSTAGSASFLGAFTSIIDPTAFGSDLIFQGTDATHGAQLWISDGTVAGTHMLTTPSAASATETVTDFQVLGGKAFFSAQEADGDSYLWSSDGTSAGTGILAIHDSTGALLTRPDLIGVMGGRLYFDAYGNGGVELWSTDGTVAGSTELVHGDIYIGTIAPQLVDGEIFYNDQPAGAANIGLYVRDGNSGAAQLVANAYVDSVITPVGQHLVFSGSGGLFVSDGTLASTTQVADGSIVYGSQAMAGGELFFLFAPATGGEQLWISDGTAGGTQVLLDPGAGSISDIHAVGSEVLFDLSDQAHGTELWVSDGTAAGTHLLADINAPATRPVTLETTGAPAVSAVLNNTLIFAAEVEGRPALYALSAPDATPVALWSVPYQPYFSQPTFTVGDLLVVGDRAFFVQSSTSPFTSPNTLWSTQGSAGDAVDLTPGGSISDLTVFGDQVYFEERTGSITALYRSDGTLAGTSQVAAMTLGGQPVVAGGKLFLVDNSGQLFVTGGAPGDLTRLGTVTGASDLTASGAKVFFVATSDAGQELWVTDGTGAGAMQVSDIAPGATSSSPAQLTAFGGGVTFTADDGLHGRQVWVSDGTAAGTHLLDINPLADPSASLQVVPGTTYNGHFYFVGNDGVHGDQLFETDGAAGSGTLIANLGGAFEYAGSFGVINGRLVFQDQGAIWVSDGTAAATMQLTGPWTSVSELTPFDGLMYFSGQSGAYGDGFFVTDGTQAGTHAILAYGEMLGTAGNDIYVWGGDQSNHTGLFAYDTVAKTTTFLGSTGFVSRPMPAVAIGSELYFTALASTSGDSLALWKSDGTAAGTSLVLAPSDPDDNFAGLTVLGGKLYFEDSSGLWTSDGTTAGTHEIASITARNLVAIGGKLIFTGYDAAHGGEVWSYDPTTQTAALVVDANPGSAPSNPYGITPDGSGGYYFVASDANGVGELWRVSAAGQATQLSSPGNGAIDTTYEQSDMTLLGSKLLFGGHDSVHGDGLFVSDGTQVTFLAAVAVAPDFTLAGNLLYFQGGDPTNGQELWVTDGTAAGTHRVTNTTLPASANASQFTPADGQLFFSATDGVHGQELWSFNGVSAHMVADLDAGAASSNPTDLTAFAGGLYFVASDGAGAELWRSDGTAGGTTEITSLANGANAQFLTVVGGKLFFYGQDSAHGAGLFVTDGTSAGTHFLTGFSLAAGANPGFSGAAGELYFDGPAPGGGIELWESDGTVAGTQAVAGATVDDGSFPSDLTTLGGLAAPLDFGGDGKAELFLQNTAGAVVTGAVGAAGQTSFAQVSALGSEWRFLGSGDFLDHGQAQYLIENGAGAVVLGEIGAGGQAAYVQVASLGPEWSFHGAGDFLGHGDDQFLIQNGAGAVVVGEIENGQAVYSQVAALGSEWSFKGVGDFLGDGKADFLIENGSGAVVLGEVGANGQATYTQVAALGPEWSFKGVGDLLGDGKSDFLIENGAGAMVVGEVANGHVTYTQIAALGPEWSVRGVGDYLGDGHDQLLIQNTAGAAVLADYVGGHIQYQQVAALGPEWSFHT